MVVDAPEPLVAAEFGRTVRPRVERGCESGRAFLDVHCCFSRGKGFQDIPRVMRPQSPRNHANQLIHCTVAYIRAPQDEMVPIEAGKRSLVWEKIFLVRESASRAGRRAVLTA